MNGYKLTKEWFFFARNNLDKVECKHTATYLYIVELFNQNQWVEVIGLPTDYTMASLNIKSYKTYKKILDDLESFNKIKFNERSKNIFTSNKIALVKNTKATTKAIPLQVESDTKAIPKQRPKRYQSDSTIIKLINKETNKPINIKTYKLIENNVSLLEKKLEDWLKEEFDKEKKIETEFFNDEVEDCFYQCLEFFDSHLHPKNKKGITSWKYTIQKLNTVHKIPFPKIIQITKRARSDDFWKKNFLSLTKLLRKNPDNILYIVYFNEKFKNTTEHKSNAEIFKDALESEVGKNFRFQ